MDQATQENLDSILQDELARGFRVKDIPAQLQAMMKVEGLEPLTRVRFTRLNPRKKAKIADTVQRAYFKDLKDQEIPSHDAMLKLAEERGEWNGDMKERMQALATSVDAAQKSLYLDGLGSTDWSAELLQASTVYRSKVEESGAPEDLKKEIGERFDRWVAHSPDRQAYYTTIYAESQGLPAYSPDRDYNWLLDHLPDQDSAAQLELIEEVKGKVQNFQTYLRDRVELHELQNRYTKLIEGTAEARRDALEELARIFFCVERVDANDNPIGTIAKTVDALWDFPPEVTQFLQVHYFLFANGIPEEAADYLKTFGFLAADRERNEATTESVSGNGASEPSVESPAPQSSRTALPPVKTTDANSSASEPPTT